MAESDSIFDRILRKELPSKAIYEDEWGYAFKDVNPIAPIHVLVIPKKKIKGFADLDDLDDQNLLGYMKSIKKTAEVLSLEQGYRVVFNQGKIGQQTVEYLHAHIISGRALSWPPG